MCPTTLSSDDSEQIRYLQLLRLARIYQPIVATSMVTRRSLATEVISSLATEEISSAATEEICSVATEEISSVATEEIS